MDEVPRILEEVKMESKTQENSGGIDQLCSECLTSARRLGQLEEEAEKAAAIVQVLEMSYQNLDSNEYPIIFVSKYLKQELRRQTCKDLMGGGEDEEETNTEERNIDDGERKIEEEERNIDAKERKIDQERDVAVLCRNAHCLGSLLQSWVVENFLEVSIALNFCLGRNQFKPLICLRIPRWQRRSRCAIIT